MNLYMCVEEKRRSNRIALGCPGQDLNLHASRRYHLKVVRLPVPPPGRGRFAAAKLYAAGQTCRGCEDWPDENDWTGGGVPDTDLAGSGGGGGGARHDLQRPLSEPERQRK